MTDSYETTSDGRMFRRVSVLLDGKTFEALNTLMQKKHLRISDIIRLSIMHYFQHEMGEKSDLSDLEKIVQELMDGSHLIVDLETVVLLLKNLDGNSEKFCKIAEKDGYKHGSYYKSVGIDNFEEILKRFELKNWFKLRSESENCYFLTLPDPELQKYIVSFLRGLSEALGIKVEIKNISERNIILRVG